MPSWSPASIRTRGRFCEEAVDIQFSKVPFSPMAVPPLKTPRLLNSFGNWKAVRAVTAAPEDIPPTPRYCRSGIVLNLSSTYGITGCCVII